MDKLGGLPLLSWREPVQVTQDLFFDGWYDHGSHLLGTHEASAGP